jgi:class 3 adenylate cyclase
VISRLEVPVLAARASPPERDEAWGLARTLLLEALRRDPRAVTRLPERSAEALADVLPEVEEVRKVGASAADPASRRALALEAAVRLVEEYAPEGLVVAVDDLQWVDATSLTVLGLLLRRVPVLGLVVAVRPEAVDSGEAVTGFLRDLPDIASTVVTVSLGPLSARALRDIVAGGRLAEVIVEETGGGPFAVAEVLRALAERGLLATQPGGRWAPRGRAATEVAREVARAGQRRAVLTRASRLSPACREMLGLLALLGRETPARVLTQARGTHQETMLADLHALARSGLARLGDEGWATAHSLIADTIAEGLDRAERGRLHQALARALEAEGAESSELARHLVGAGDPEAAAAAFARAAQQSLERFANEEADRLANTGLGLHPQASVCSALLRTRAEARARRGELPEAREDLRAILATTEAGPERSRVRVRLAVLTGGSSDWARAAELVELALDEAGADPGARAEALAAAAVIDVNRNRLDVAEARCAEALELFEQLGDAHGVTSVLDALGMVVLFQGRLREAAEMLDGVARRFRDSGGLLSVGTPQTFHGWALALMGRAQEGLPAIDEALELERTLGQIEGEATCLWGRSEALSALGRAGEARQSAEAGLAVARRLGHNEYTAMLLGALGASCVAAGDLEGAESAFHEAVGTAEGMPIHASMAAGRLASVLQARGDPAGAELWATRCLTMGNPATQYEGHLVLAEVALARGVPNAETQVGEALARVEAVGYRWSPARGRLERVMAAPPGGVPSAPAPQREHKTFLFTDMVKSTSLVEALGDEAWSHLLRWHDDTLGSLFTSHGGSVVNRTGDGFFVVFADPEAAVECAVGIQRALDRHRRDHGFAPVVRIGLHEAEATYSGGDYHGKGVHIAARLGAVAEGGEILASRATAAGSRHRGASAPRTMSLRGLPDPVEVVSISWR